MHEKPDHLLPADRVTIGLQMQLELAFPWTHAQGANQVQALMVVKTLVQTVGVCLRGAQVRLSGETSEKPLSSRKTRVAPSLRHFFYLWPEIAFPMGDRDLVSRQTPPLWLLTTPTESSQEIPNTSSHDTVRETGPRSNEQSDPVSSTLPPSRTHKPHALRRTLNAGVERRINGWDALALAHAACVCGVGLATPSAHALRCRAHALGNLRGRWSVV